MYLILTGFNILAIISTIAFMIIDHKNLEKSIIEGV
jgi:hypothetical protein